MSRENGPPIKFDPGFLVSSIVGGFRPFFQGEEG